MGLVSWDKKAGTDEESQVGEMIWAVALEHLFCPQTISPNTWVSIGLCWLHWSH